MVILSPPFTTGLACESNTMLLNVVVVTLFVRLIVLLSITSVFPGRITGFVTVPFHVIGSVEVSKPVAVTLH